MIFPCGIYFLVLKKKNLIYGLFTSIMTVYLFYSETRSVYLAILVSGLVSFLLFIFKWILNKKNPVIKGKKIINKKKILILIIILVVLFVLFVSFYKPAGLGKINPYKRFMSIFDPNHGTIRFRIHAWLNSVEMIKDNPILGVGIGNWKYIYPLYARSAKIDLLFSAERQPYNTHNDYVQIFTETGLIGGTAFLLLLAVCFITALKSFFQEEDYPTAMLSLSLLWALLTFVIIAFFSFPFELPVSALVFWLIISFIQVISIRKEVSKNKKLPPVQKVFYKMCLNSIKVILIFFGFLNFWFMKGDFEVKKGIKFWNSGDTNRGIHFMERGSSNYFIEFKHHLRVGSSYMRLKMYKKSYKKIKTALKLHPNYINTLNNMGIILNVMGNSFESLEVFQKAIQIKPDSPHLHYSIGFTYLSLGDKERAISEVRTTVELNPPHKGAREQLDKL